METFKLSPSALNLFKECERCFWLDKHKVWKRPTTGFPTLPAGMDRILKNHFDKFMEKGVLPPELHERDGCKNLKLFDDADKLKIWRNNFKGVSWKDKKGNELHGAVDNLLVNYGKSELRLNKKSSSKSKSSSARGSCRVNKNKGGKLIVLDYKTRGYPTKEDTAEHYRLQLDLYNFLLRKNDYDTEDYAFLLFYIPREVLPTGEVMFDTELKKMKININNAKKTWEDALECLNGECPNKSCEWCEKV